MEINSNQARLTLTCIRGKTSPSYLIDQNYIVYIYLTADNDLSLSLSTRPVIPTFSPTLTVCCALLAPCQSLQPTMSEQTVL